MKVTIRRQIHLHEVFPQLPFVRGFGKINPGIYEMEKVEVPICGAKFNWIILKRPDGRIIGRNEEFFRLWQEAETWGYPQVAITIEEGEATAEAGIRTYREIQENLTRQLYYNLESHHPNGPFGELVERWRQDEEMHTHQT